MDDVAARCVKAGDEVEPLERLPEAAPRRLQLPRARHPVGVGADREKRGIAEIEQSGKADDDVEAERQGSEGQRIRRRIDVGVVLVNQRKQQRRRGDAEDGEAGARRGETPANGRARLNA